MQKNNPEYEGPVENTPKEFIDYQEALRRAGGFGLY
jgi:hypothetical protein